MEANIKVPELLAAMSTQLQQHLKLKQRSLPVMVGIHSGGVWLAEKLHALLKIQEPLGKLDIAFYRDDFTRIGLHPEVKPSQLPFQIENRHVILIDDVLMSGRTIRAALNELFDYGRPASVTLAVLIDLDARELPVQADIVGKQLALSPGERIKLTGPAPLGLIIQRQTPKDS